MSGGKSKTGSAEMHCMNSFPSLAVLCALQTEGIISCETCLFRAAEKQAVFLLTEMNQPKQPVNS